MIKVINRIQKQFLFFCITLIISCLLSQVSSASQAVLAIHLENDNERNYYLEIIENISFDDSTLHIITAHQQEAYSLESIKYLEILLDDLTSITDLGKAKKVIQVSHLFQNYPNPFNPHTQIAFELPRKGRVKLCIYDVSGRLVRTLVNDDRPSGQYNVQWDGRNDSGKPVTSGAYFYSLKAPGIEESKKMIMLR